MTRWTNERTALRGHRGGERNLNSESVVRFSAATKSAIQLDLIDDSNNNNSELLKREQRTWMRTYSSYLVEVRADPFEKLFLSFISPFCLCMQKWFQMRMQLVEAAAAAAIKIHEIHYATRWRNSDHKFPCELNLCWAYLHAVAIFPISNKMSFNWLERNFNSIMIHGERWTLLNAIAKSVQTPAEGSSRCDQIVYDANIQDCRE